MNNTEAWATGHTLISSIKAALETNEGPIEDTFDHVCDKLGFCQIPAAFEDFSDTNLQRNNMRLLDSRVKRFATIRKRAKGVTTQPTVLGRVSPAVEAMALLGNGAHDKANGDPCTREAPSQRVIRDLVYLDDPPYAKRASVYPARSVFATCYGSRTSKFAMGIKLVLHIYAIYVITIEDGGHAYYVILDLPEDVTSPKSQRLIDMVDLGIRATSNFSRVGLDTIKVLARCNCMRKL